MITPAEKALAFALDGAMCGMMNYLQWRRREEVCSRPDFEAYIKACAGLSREEFYHVPAIERLTESATLLQWDSPHPGPYVENQRTRVSWHPVKSGADTAPTVLLLHALMSANDSGYMRVARWFNDRGWNAVFPHLPLHYSRTPRGFKNGELAITADLIRNAETLRQSVVELRQLMAYLRSRGCPEFGLIGMSWGGWTSALLSFVEQDFRFVALIQPVVNIEHAIWDNPSAHVLRRLLRRKGIQRGESHHHSHLSSPLHGTPLCGGEHVILTAGTYDTIAPLCEIEAVALQWPGAKLLTVRQGHFGYTALPTTLKEIEGRL